MSPENRQLAHRLGYAGLIPFVLGCALVWLFGDGKHAEQHYWVTLALSAYAALIISFLGGIQWGLAFVSPAAPSGALIWGISASLLGWLGALLSPYGGLALHGGVLIACYVADRRLYPKLGASDWLTLRFRLTAVASLSCFLAAAGS